MGGMSRSGSTLLCALLNQNPKIHVSENSPVCDLTYKLNLLFDSNHQYQACPFENRRINVVKSLIDNYYFDVSKPIIIDKFRSWGTPYNISMIKTLYTEDVKIICPVRNVLEILTSWLVLFKKNQTHTSFIDKHIDETSRINLSETERDVRRCDLLMNMDGGIFHQLKAMELSVQSEYKSMFHLIDYDSLIKTTKSELKRLYQFLNVKPYTHQLNQIEFSSHSKDDSYFGVPGLHEVRKTINKISRDPLTVLPEEVIEKYSGLEFWKERRVFS